MMEYESFKRIVTTFADGPDDLEVKGRELHMVVGDDIIEAKLSYSGEDLLVEENGCRLRAQSWLVKRLARLPLLAGRILDYVKPTDCFVAPTGTVLPHDERPDPGSAPGAPSGADVDMADAVAKTLGRREPGATSVWYLTAGAGEGKTSLINHVARTQAEAYRSKKANWLLVPFPLGGGTFLRFDDVVIANLVNRLRFQFLYYEAFLELVRLGVVVPAFDGFEEVIVDRESGEAITALGRLVQRLHSEGTVLMAARTAFFEYVDFRSQARLFDAIGKGDVAFGRFALNHWDRDCFVEYADKRSVQDPVALYDQLSEGLPADHPLLTRPVLARRVVDSALDSGEGFKTLLERVNRQPDDFLHEFVSTIVGREARTKWLDRSGNPPQPLLTADEHDELLSLMAREMWLGSVDALKSDSVGFVVELFAENTQKPTAVARQVLRRLPQHALLKLTAGARHTLAFDHEEFRQFYLGEALGRDIVRAVNHVGDDGPPQPAKRDADGEEQRDAREVRELLEVAAFPGRAVGQAALHVQRRYRNLEDVLRLLQTLPRPRALTSFVQQNCGALTLALLDRASEPWSAEGLSFPEGALQGRTLRGLTVQDSHFLPTSLSGAHLEDCTFARCQFDRLDGEAASIRRTTLDSCDIGGVTYDGDELVEYAPARKRALLERMGFSIEPPETTSPDPRDRVPALPTEDMELAQRALRTFSRSTAVNESIWENKLGRGWSQFNKNILRRLEAEGILAPEPNLRHGSQRVFRLGVPMQCIQVALAESDGDLDSFLKAARQWTRDRGF